MMGTRTLRETSAIFLNRQHGVVLLVALIVLVAMTLAAVSLVRSIDTGNMVAGNLAFKQGATAAADSGTEAAITWLASRVGTPELHVDVPTQGYYATSQDTLDMTGTSGNDDYAVVDWDNNNCGGVSASVCVKPSAAINAGNGNSVTYIIHRLCKSNGDRNSTENSCAAFFPADSTSPNRGEIRGDNIRIDDDPSEYYRITSRVKGPKNTVSFVETIIHF